VIWTVLGWLAAIWAVLLAAFVWWLWRQHKRREAEWAKRRSGTLRNP